MVKFGVDHATNSSFLKHEIEDIKKSALLADSLGYDDVFLMDHINWTPTSSQISNNWLVLASLIDQITNSNLGILVSDPHRYHPALLSQMYATLDNLMNGRFILGMGAGEGANLNQYGIKWDKPFTRLKEAIEIMFRLWESKSSSKWRVTYNGEFFKLKDAFLQIRPNKMPPNLWIAGNGPKTRALTAKYATGWIPTSTTPKLYSKWTEEIDKHAQENDRDPKDIDHAYQIYVCITENDQSAFNMLRPIMTSFCLKHEIIKEYNLEFPEGVDYHSNITYNTLLGMKKEQRKIFEIAECVPDSLINEMCAYGSVDSIISKLEEFIRSGVDHFVLMFIGKEYYNQIRIFADKILTYFRQD
ncbi:MAG: LLM class flavin-dependent oxidoreductase [Candidatus Lokiarchaeota archaeon]|nr:LLM class flavin-dependent oxidoreductase [Candidatus Lokiarchaeota archaeon]